MIQVTINNQTTNITDLRQYSRLLEIEYLKKDAALNVALKTIEDLQPAIEKIEEDVNFVKGKYTKSIHKPSIAKQAKEERKQVIRLKMATRGKKS